MYSLVLSFTNTVLPASAKFIGLTNYRILFTRDPVYIKSLLNTLYYVVVKVPLGMIIALFVAQMLNQKIVGVRLYRTVFYLPTVVSAVALSMLWKWLLDSNFGMINSALALMGIEGPGWITDPRWSKFSIAMMGSWQVGRSMIVFLAALQDVPPMLYEAAVLDGAGPFRKFFRITLPLITPAIYFNLIMDIIGSFQTFTEALIMTNGGPLQSTYFYALYLYEEAFKNSRMGNASAMAWVLLIVILTVTLIVQKASKRWVFYQSEES